MFNKKDFELVPYHNNLRNSNEVNNLNKNLLISVQETIIKIINFSDVILMHQCDDFQNFIGRDIDTFYISKNKFLNINTKENFIFHKREDGSYRFLINNKTSNDFFNLDIEDLDFFSPKTKHLNKINVQDAIKCHNTGLKHFKLNAIIYYKLVKYFSKGIVFSYEQLYKLKKILNSIKDKDLDYILHLTSKNLPKENIYIKKLVEYNFDTYESDIEIKKFWIKKRIIRQNKRKVFAGKLKLKNLFKSKRFIYAFLFGSFAKWPRLHNPLPAIAIVGNDGAGKTSLCNYFIKNFSKMDPAYFNMKSDQPLFSFTKFMNKLIKKIINNIFIKKIVPIKIFFKLLGQTIDIFDQYIKYRIGMAFADAGFGVTIFERYITDKLRGEFPNKENRFLPLEQFFPLPDGIFYLDVKPEISIKRKPNDDHTLDEMISKRKNYMSLLKDFSEVKIVPADTIFDENIKELKNYFFKLALKKKNLIKFGLKLKRCKWNKNRNRILAGDPKKRFQKGSFL